MIVASSSPNIPPRCRLSAGSMSSNALAISGRSCRGVFMFPSRSRKLSPSLRSTGLNVPSPVKAVSRIELFKPFSIDWKETESPPNSRVAFPQASISPIFSPIAKDDNRRSSAYLLPDVTENATPANARMLDKAPTALLLILKKLFPALSLAFLLSSSDSSKSFVDFLALSLASSTSSALEANIIKKVSNTDLAISSSFSVSVFYGKILIEPRHDYRFPHYKSVFQVVLGTQLL